MSAEMNATQLRKLARILDGLEKLDEDQGISAATVNPTTGRVRFNPERAARRYFRARLTVTVLGPCETAVKP